MSLFTHGVHFPATFIRNNSYFVQKREDIYYFEWKPEQGSKLTFANNFGKFLYLRESGNGDNTLVFKCITLRADKTKNKITLRFSFFSFSSSTNKNKKQNI